MIPVLHRAQEKQAPPGIGVEIDVWLNDADPPVPGWYASVDHEGPISDSFDGWLRTDVARAGFRPLYAVNCKSDGLEQPIARAFAHYGVPADCWFAFDMSYPSQRVFEKAGLPFAERVSEEEPWRVRSHRIWLDRWDWSPGSIYEVHPYEGARRGIYLPTLTGDGKRVEVHAVSIELHVPDTTSQQRRDCWWWLFEKARPVSVCTDYPDELMEAWERWQ